MHRKHGVAKLRTFEVMLPLESEWLSITLAQQDEPPGAGYGAIPGEPAEESAHPPGTLLAGIVRPARQRRFCRHHAESVGANAAPEAGASRSCRPSEATPAGDSGAGEPGLPRASQAQKVSQSEDEIKERLASHVLFRT